MATRRLNAEEAAAWARVMASVRPLRSVAGGPPPSRGAGPPSSPLLSAGGAASSPLPQAGGAAPSPLPRAGGAGGGHVTNVAPGHSSSPKRDGSAEARARPREATSSNTLDGRWDRRLSRGLAQPDSTLDLHGHTLHSAHLLLDQGLERALARGDRVLLLVTGRPPRPESERPHARGAIRAAVADWLAAGRFADRIAAVRNAHPRHGGAGALYIVLRRRGPTPGA